MNYQRAIQWLYSTQAFGIKLGLDNIHRLIREIGATSVNDRRIVHVAGTNGKGSVCAMVDAIFQEAGGNWRPGLFTSPHLVTFRERICVAGEMIPEFVVAETLTEIRDLVEDWDQHPTFFEITLALACRHFVEEGCEVIILETGMGGHFDATNAFDSDVTAIMPIGLDHQQWLGESLTEIAGEKAGIIKPGVPNVMAPQAPEAGEVVRVASADSPLIEIANPIPHEWMLGLAGQHQRMNAAVAVAIARQIAPDLSEATIREGLARVSWPARFQRLQGGKFIVDGAHNKEAAEVLAETWRSEYGDGRATLIFGSVEGKNTIGVINEIAHLAERFFFVKVNSQRGMQTDDLLALTDGEAFPSLAAAIRKAETFPERVLICGSLFLAGEAIARLDDERDFESSEQ